MNSNHLIQQLTCIIAILIAPLCLNAQAESGLACLPEDLNQDRYVDLADFGAFAAQWLQANSLPGSSTINYSDVLREIIALQDCLDKTYHGDSEMSRIANHFFHRCGAIPHNNDRFCICDLADSIDRVPNQGLA